MYKTNILLYGWGLKNRFDEISMMKIHIIMHLLKQFNSLSGTSLQINISESTTFNISVVFKHQHEVINLVTYPLMHMHVVFNVL